MRWLLLSAVVCGLSITDEASRAEGPPDAQRLSPSQSTPQDAGFFATTGVVRFQIVQGRLCLDSPRHRKGSQSRDQDGVYESITVTAERGIPSLHYICQRPNQHLTLSVEKANHVRIESFCPETTERSVLDQPHRGPVQWSIQRGEAHEVHSGSTLLHLRQCDPAGFDKHHGDLVRRLLRGRSVRQISEATRDELVRQTEVAQTPDADSIRETIDELRSPRRAQRAEAQRKLLSWGTPIVPVIQRISRDDLDAEQRDRIRVILQRLRVPVNDTPASLALLLIIDREYWSLLAPQLTSDQLLAANDHLSRCGLEQLFPIDSQSERIAAVND